MTSCLCTPSTNQTAASGGTAGGATGSQADVSGSVSHNIISDPDGSRASFVTSPTTSRIVPRRLCLGSRYAQNSFHSGGVSRYGNQQPRGQEVAEKKHRPPNHLVTPRGCAQ